jgi:TolB-like protein
MEKDKEKRYQSAGELHSELENIEKGIPTTERVVSKRKPITSREITVTFGLKKLFIPALIFVAVVIIGVVIWQLLPKKETIPSEPRKQSIAVLPFADLSPQKDQEHFCDGMTDEIITKLSALEGLKVISRTSVMRYKETEKDIREIGKDLDVTTVLEGTIRKEEDDIRITTRLVNVEDLSQIWAKTYNQKLEHILNIQSEVAENIALALKQELSPEERERLQRKPTQNIEAYNLSLLGKYHLYKFTDEGFRKARYYYEEAIKKDPEFATAYAGLGNYYMEIGSDAGNLPPKETFPLAKKAVARALEIDQTLGETHSVLGKIKYYYDWDWAEAEVELKRGIELSLNSAEAHSAYALYLASVGRLEEAISESKRCLELDPLSARHNSDLVWLYVLAGQHDKAIEQSSKAMELDPNFWVLYWNLGLVYSAKGLYKEAIDIFQEGAILSGEQPNMKGTLGWAYAKANENEKAIKILEELKQLLKKRYVPKASIAWIYIGLGEKDLAFEWLDKAYEEHDQSLMWLKGDLTYDSIREDSRFKELLRKIGLEK